MKEGKPPKESIWTTETCRLCFNISCLETSKKKESMNTNALHNSFLSFYFSCKYCALNNFSLNSDCQLLKKIRWMFSRKPLNYTKYTLFAPVRLIFWRASLIDQSILLLDLKWLYCELPKTTVRRQRGLGLLR